MADHAAPNEPLFDEIKRRLGVHPEDDHADWDVSKHGHMAEHATGPEDEPATVPWEG